MKVTKIHSQFFSQANSIPKYNLGSDTISVVASIWKVKYEINFTQMYSITLSNRNPDRRYDSMKPGNNHPFFYQIHRFDPGKSQVDYIPIASKEKGDEIKTVKYNVPEEASSWQPFDMDKFLSDSDSKIQEFVQDRMGFYFKKQKKEEDLKKALGEFKAKIKTLKLDNEEAKFIFHDIFLEYLKAQIIRTDSKVTFPSDSKVILPEDFSEKKPLLNGSSSSSSDQTQNNSPLPLEHTPQSRSSCLSLPSCCCNGCYD